MADIRNDQYLFRAGAGRGEIKPADPLEVLLYDGSGNPLLVKTPTGETRRALGVAGYGYDGTNWRPVKVNASGQAEVTLTGSRVPQASRLLTNTPLGANQSFTQPTQVAKDVVIEHVLGVAYVGASVYADTQGVLLLQELHGSVWMTTGRWPVGGNERQIIPLQPITTGTYRWQYINGSTAQTAFELYEFGSQIDGRIRPVHLHVLHQRVIPAGGRLFMGQTQLLGYTRAALYIRCDRQYSLGAWSGVGRPIISFVPIASNQPATGNFTRYHQIPQEVLPTFLLDVSIDNLDSANDATVDLWFVATP